MPLAPTRRIFKDAPIAWRAAEGRRGFGDDGALQETSTLPFSFFSTSS
jgi:hypothetical protein